MCKICLQLNANNSNASLKEKLDTIGEAIIKAKTKEEKSHLLDLSNSLVDKAMPFSEADKDLEKNWHKYTYED